MQVIAADGVVHQAKALPVLLASEELDVYQAALDLVVVADEIVEALPPGRAYLRDQLRRASSSIISNIAEGVGELSPKEKVRFYRMARWSAVECASHGLVCRQLELVDGSLLERGLSLLHRIVAMLTSMVKKRAD
jgi:four helix bundle protein